MKKTILLIAAITIIGCQKEKVAEISKVNKTENTAAVPYKEMTDDEISREAQRIVDSAANAIDNAALSDLANEAKNQKGSPIEVLKAEFVGAEYSNRKNISIKYKNISDKDITAIKFEWYGKDAFGDPADMGNPITEGYGTGFTDQLIKSGQTKDATWEIFSNDGKTITAARAYEVAFEDGSKWKTK